MKRNFGKSTLMRSRDYLEEQGWYCEVVEQNMRVGLKTWKKDLWGFADLLCVRPGEVMAVQSTSYSNVSSRVRKIEDSDNLPRVRRANIKIVVHGWRAVKPSKDAKSTEWTVREVDLS